MATPPVRGRFLWHELMTSDTGSAEDFYKKVVGWKVQAWDTDPSYKMFTAGRVPVCGLLLQRVDPNQVMPPRWFTYIGTPEVDATVRQAVEFGGKVIRSAMDVPNVGRFASLQDPQGAAFAVFTPVPSPTPMGSERPGLGEFSWHELATTNWQSAWNFYQRLFGWEKTSSMEMAPGQTYQMFGANGRPMGGMYNRPSGQPGVPSWLPYAVVRDAKRAAEIIKQSGGTVINGPMEVPGGDWIVAGLDRQGAMFAVHALKPVVVAKSAASASKAARKSKAAPKRAVKKSKPTPKKSKPAKRSAKKAKPSTAKKRRR